MQAQQGFAQPTYGVQQLPMYQQPLTNISSQYLQPVHPLQQPLHNHGSSQPPAVHAIGQPQAHMPSQQSVHRHGQLHPMPSASTVNFVQPTRPVAEHYNYGNVQPQQWSGNNAVDSRKRKAETLQVSA